MATFTELTETLLAYVQTKSEIAELRARNQNAPKYLHEQAKDLQERATQLSELLDESQLV